MFLAAFLQTIATVGFIVVGIALVVLFLGFLLRLAMDVQRYRERGRR